MKILIEHDIKCGGVILQPIKRKLLRKPRLNVLKKQAMAQPANDPVLANLGHDHAEAGHDHAEAGHDHAEAGHNYAEAGHDHAKAAVPAAAARYGLSRARVSGVVLLFLVNLLGWVTYENATSPMEPKPDNPAIAIAQQAGAPAKAAVQVPVQEMPVARPAAALVNEPVVLTQADEDEPRFAAPKVEQAPGPAAALVKGPAVLTQGDEVEPRFVAPANQVQRPLVAISPVGATKADARDGKRLPSLPSRPANKAPGGAEHQFASKSMSLPARALPGSAQRKVASESKSLPSLPTRPARTLPRIAKNPFATKSKSKSLPTLPSQQARTLPRSAERQLASKKKNSAPQRSRKPTTAKAPAPAIDSDVALLTALTTHVNRPVVRKHEGQ